MKKILKGCEIAKPSRKQTESSKVLMFALKLIAIGHVSDSRDLTIHQYMMLKI